MCFWLVENEFIFHATQVQLYNGGKLQIACAHCQNFACFDFLWCFFLWQSPNLRKKSNVKTHISQSVWLLSCGVGGEGVESHSELNRHLSCHAPLTVHIYAAWSTGSSPLIYQKEKQENQEQKKNKKNKNESARVRIINFKEQVASHSLAKEGEWCNLC